MEEDKKIIFTAKEDIKKGDKIIITFHFEDFTDSSGGIFSSEDIAKAIKEHFGRRDRDVFLCAGISIKHEMEGDDNYQMISIN
jgi:hypothetical protein